MALYKEKTEIDNRTTRNKKQIIKMEESCMTKWLKSSTNSNEIQQQDQMK